MPTREDIESYFLRYQIAHKEVSPEGIWLLKDQSSGENIVVSLAGPLLLFRVKVLELGEVKDQSALFAELLRLNAADLVHGAYGIADDAVVLTCALQLENLDYNEFQSTIDDFSLALTKHYETLAKYRKVA